MCEWYLSTATLTEAHENDYENKRWHSHFKLEGKTCHNMSNDMPNKKVSMFNIGYQQI